MRHARLPFPRLHGLLDDAVPLRTHRFGHGDAAEAATDDAESDVLEAVRERARGVHERLAHDADVFAVELLGATGSGKTALVERLLEGPFAAETVGVVAGDVSGTDDADRYRDHGVAVANVTTGKDCHLDPQRLDAALDGFDLDALDVLFVENVGNMVCPADFPLGAHRRLVVVSPTEGDDVVRKHPLLFQACDAAVINKVDVADAVGAEVDRMAEDVTTVAPDTPTLRTNARTGRGIEDLAALLDAARTDAARHHG
ncbi:hydrogenase nickel incorporation protein HypB [Halorientalis regularis]|uniref:Hydrogenase nickel incorporation protein HypB n=1 Tax=Halorientalis regularis TaxID=660518 RepID=A0A1G7MRR6_9EURY|nr:hydrogenase nickel incorporation protein HypB [Halorientalis regularis]SDF64346.1 hydrogenase nickel incorporation protein HypB [Halorientalis regularis]